ncbi:MAG: B12-binding domain-containing radical SAM protein, partial [Candidatus Margulisbacteria bacterium]|nr:B12-binding domain-containing radical SAM protein [Candidatus Margulisiibacteriota bacterium]
MKRNKIILIMPGRVGLYLRDKLPPLFYYLTKNLFTWLISKRVTIPLAILSLVSYLKQGGFNVVVIDGRVEDALKRLEHELNDDVLYVGISILTGQHITYGLYCAEKVRKYNKAIPIVWGGVHATLTAEQTLSTCSLADIVVRGEGEITIVELSKALHDGTDLSKVIGISYKKNDQILHNEDRPFMDFNSQLDIDYSSLDPKYYQFDNFTYQSERGCPHRCEFCDVLVMHRRSFRKKSGERVLQELKSINDLFHPSRIAFVDDCFFADFKRANVIIDGLIKAKMGFKWHASCRAQYFKKTDAEFWKKAKSSGLSEVYVGVESGSQKILDYIKKDCTVEDILNG